MRLFLAELVAKPIAYFKSSIALTSIERVYVDWA